MPLSGSNISLIILIVNLNHWPLLHKNIWARQQVWALSNNQFHNSGEGKAAAATSSHSLNAFFQPPLLVDSTAGDIHYFREFGLVALLYFWTNKTRIIKMSTPIIYLLIIILQTICRNKAMITCTLRATAGSVLAR